VLYLFSFLRLTLLELDLASGGSSSIEAPKHGRAPKMMCDRTTRIGVVFRLAGIHARKCVGQKYTVRRGGGRLALAPEVSRGALTSLHFTPVRWGSS